jgi:hypothetical protein
MRVGQVVLAQVEHAPTARVGEDVFIRTHSEVHEPIQKAWARSLEERKPEVLHLCGVAPVRPRKASVVVPGDRATGHVSKEKSTVRIRRELMKLDHPRHGKKIGGDGLVDVSVSVI